MNPQSININALSIGKIVEDKGKGCLNILSVYITKTTELINQNCLNFQRLTAAAVQIVNTKRITNPFVDNTGIMAGLINISDTTYNKQRVYGLSGWFYKITFVSRNMYKVRSWADNAR